jgi:hypothetical protein
MLQPCDCNGIDVHAHVVPEHGPAHLGSKLTADWPSTAAAPQRGGLCHRHVRISGKPYRTVSELCWNPARRLQDLPGMGLRRQVISPMPALLSTWRDAPAAQQLLRYLNEQTAAMVAEAGGTLPSLLPWLQQGWRVFPALQEQIPVAPVEQARRLFFDTLVFDRATLRHLVDCFGAGQPMRGSDHPFDFHDHHPAQRVREAGFDAATVDALLFRNAERFLGLEITP